MFNAALSSLSHLLSPPFRSVLLKAVGLAALLLVILAIGLHRALAWLAAYGDTWVQGAWGVSMPGFLAWIFSILAALGLVFGAIFLVPAATATVAGLFADEIAEHVERTDFPNDPPGTALPVSRGLLEGVKTALWALLIYLCAIPFLLFAGIGVLIFFVATAFLLGREYFELAAMRFHPVSEAKALRRQHASTVFLAGLLIATFVSIPIVNLATPLFGTALMVHVHKRIISRT